MVLMVAGKSVSRKFVFHRMTGSKTYCIVSDGGFSVNINFKFILKIDNI